MQVSFDQPNVQKLVIFTGIEVKSQRWIEMDSIQSLTLDSMVIRKVEDQIQVLMVHCMKKYLDMMISEELEQKTIGKSIQKAICTSIRGLRSRIG